MFSFDGDFKRRPQQNLGGASHQKSDRLTIIKKAQHERQKREEIRKQQNGAKIIQSCVRSFVQRQNIKHRERIKFDEYSKTAGLKNCDDLDYLTKRLLFFYFPKDIKDGERFIFICQYFIKQPKKIFEIANRQPILIYRIKKILGLCLSQMFSSHHSPTIPLRMLETYSSNEHVIKHVPQSNQFSIKEYLESVFAYLIMHKYYETISKLIKDKIPDIDEDTIVPPNPISDAIYQMLVRPLRLISEANEQYTSITLLSFINHILSSDFETQIRHFVLPNLAGDLNFPYLTTIKYVAVEYQKEVDFQNTILIDLDDDTTKKRKKSKVDCLNLSSFLLYSTIKLDVNSMSCKMNDVEYFEYYIKVIASMIDNISKLPKVESFQQLDDTDDSDGEDEDVQMLSTMEQSILLETVDMLNDATRVNYILEHIELILQNHEALLNLCKICHNLMTYNRFAVYEYKLLYMLAIKPQFIRGLWYTLTSQTWAQGFQSPISLLSKGLSISKQEADRIVPVLATFCALFGRLITNLHDGEFCQENVLPGTISRLMPFTLQEIIPLSTTLKEISLGLIELAFPETRSSLKDHYRNIFNSDSSGHFKNDNNEPNINVWPHLMKVCVSLLRKLYTRDLRIGFCSETHWTAQALNLPLDKPTDLHLIRGRRGLRPFQPIRDFTREDYEDGPPLSTKQIRSITILREIPFVVAFNTRVNVLQGLLAADKLRTQGDLQGFLQGPSIQLVVRRSHLYEDAFDKLSPMNEADLRPKFRIQMVNSAGMKEAGIDGGGVFREFLSELIKTAFDPNRGFFMITNDNLLYPNPGVAKIVEDFQRHYYFIGRILGKALYENLLVELPLAEFFLTKLAGKHSDVDVHQLASLDPVLHRNLMSLKAYEGDVADLGLDFTVVSDELGETKIEELKPNGVNIVVNSSNRIEYIQLMADYKLNRQIRQQCMAFRQGLANVLPIEWLYMFSNKELQVLISGAEIPVDLDDLRLHTKYSGDYSNEHPTIELFWKTLETFDDLQKRQLLKFVTSCSRPPLLGFKDLDPPFCIQNSVDTERLPSASTCMNLLKLPAFNDEKMMREKLLYAIESGAGFELS